MIVFNLYSKQEWKTLPHFRLNADLKRLSNLLTEHHWQVCVCVCGGGTGIKKEWDLDTWDVSKSLACSSKEQPSQWPRSTLSSSPHVSCHSPLAVFMTTLTLAHVQMYFPNTVFCLCSFLCPGTYFHPLIPVSLRGPILMASWWKLFSAPQAESIILSLLSKHSTFPSSGASIILWFECQLTINTPQDSTLLDGGDCIWFHFVILCLCSQCLG